MSSQNTAKEGLKIPDEYYLPYASLDYQQHRQPAPYYDPYFHQAQPVIPPRAYAPPPQNYGYEPGQYYAPDDPAAYAPTQGYYDYAQWQQPAPAGYYTPTGAQYAQHPRGNEAQYPYNTTHDYGQPAQSAAARQSQQTFGVRAPPNAPQQPVESNALQLQTTAPSTRPARPVQPFTEIPHADAANSPGASETSEPDGEFEYVFDCPDCGTSFLSLPALHAHLFIQYRRGWCPGVP